MFMKLTAEDIERLIANEQYIQPEGTTLTICVITTVSGFAFTAESACIDHANFDAQIGKDIARQEAINKLWQFEGYRVKAAFGGDWKYRLKQEYEQVKDRLTKLNAFLDNPPEVFRTEDEEILTEQQRYMKGYFDVLEERMENAGLIEDNE
jgi:hypothetical protein